jgi:hypothetical protein
MEFVAATLWVANNATRRVAGAVHLPTAALRPRGSRLPQIRPQGYTSGRLCREFDLLARIPHGDGNGLHS